MKRIARLLWVQSLFVVVAGCAAPALAQTTDSGSATLQGSVSGYVEVRAGGAATISTGGTITNNKIKGDRDQQPDDADH
jgi:hypothetical protein